jgi:hypothetical protein
LSRTPFPHIDRDVCGMALLILPSRARVGDNPGGDEAPDNSILVGIHT